MTKASSDLSIPDAVDVQSGNINITSGAVMVDSGLNVVVGSGVAIRSGLGVLISGQMVQLASGNTVQVASGQFVQINSISGQGVVINSGVGVTVASGLGVSISGQTIAVTSGTAIKVSGEVLKIQAPSALLAGYTVAGAQSGGTELVSGVVVFANVKSVSTSGDVWVGPPGILSGSGYLLQAGEEVGIDTDNLNNIYVIAEISGVNVSWMGEVV